MPEIVCPDCGGKGWKPYMKYSYLEEDYEDTGLAEGCTRCGGSGGEATLIKGTGKVSRKEETDA